MSKKFMIRCDIEGVSGVVSYDQAEPGKPEYNFGKKMFMADLMAAVNGLNDGGADEIHIYDEHFYGRNIDLEKLPDNVVAYCGKPPYRADWAGGLDESFAGMILLGFHSMKGTGELLHHTYEPDIKSIKINGRNVGEIGVETIIAGDYDVPLLMITADSAGVLEAKKLVPSVEGVIVKESVSEFGGICYPISVTTNKIYKTAKKIASSPQQETALSEKSGIFLEIELFDGAYKTNFKDKFNSYIVNGIVSINAETMTAAWAKYWEMKLNCY